MTRKKRNQWRKWQASAAATLTVAALFQYVRTSDAFDVAYAAANGNDISSTASTQINAQDDVMDEWTNNTDSHSNASSNEGNNLDRGTTEGSIANVPNQGSSGGWITDQSSNEDTDSGYSRGNYQSRTGAS
ncbi:MULTISPECIES: hypothetical protein [Paenibacillus]|uniref:Uncharacterized protein n=1 Tax=Paenibacillus taichungensis TaxID=484184 RepID=A0A329QGA7_9BACL|nr:MULTISPECIES: hypothetical protein [Paenibacillus]RAW10362.1 hypothetical protein DC345_27730 [Paenibacillus taichungensis]